jgi:hypothetical protein
MSSNPFGRPSRLAGAPRKRARTTLHKEIVMNRSAFLFAFAALGSCAWIAPAGADPLPKNHLSGIVIAVTPNALLLQMRNGKQVIVDTSIAAANGRLGVVAPKVPIVVHGTLLADGTFRCVFTSHAGPKLQDWAADQ